MFPQSRCHNGAWTDGFCNGDVTFDRWPEKRGTRVEGTWGQPSSELSEPLISVGLLGFRKKGGNENEERTRRASGIRIFVLNRRAEKSPPKQY